MRVIVTVSVLTELAFEIYKRLCDVKEIISNITAFMIREDLKFSKTIYSAFVTAVGVTSESREALKIQKHKLKGLLFV